MYLDVTSYMLTVLTFSVGFLSTRRHAHFDVLSKDLADRSWKIRQALSTGQDLGPRDLAEDVAAVSAEPDAVARFARLVNASFFVSACVVVVLGLIDHGDWHTVALLVVLFTSTVLVFALGEFDVRWMETRENDLASGTVLGQLAVIDEAIRSGRGFSAADEIARIREAYPQWGFGRELELALKAIDAVGPPADDAADAMDLLDAAAPLHVAPLIVAESQLLRRNPIGAIQDFQIVEPRSNGSRTFDRLQLVLGFEAGLPRAVFTDPGLPAHWLADETGLVLGLRSLPRIRAASESLRDFGSNISLADWSAGRQGTPTHTLVGAATADDDGLDAILTSIADPMLSGTLNSLGIVYLARGRAADALRIFELAIRARPNSSTSHWGRAVACGQRGWQDAAHDSLARAESLDPASRRVLSLTRTAFNGVELAPVANRPGQSRWTNWESVQLALLGCRVSDVDHAPGPRGELTSLVVEAALAPTSVVA